MGLKCSVIGHKYGETAVERDREEQGSEVVITIQERETCERCGKTRVISENKEVTSIETPSDIAGDMIAEDDEPADDGAVAEVDDAVEEAEPVADDVPAEAVDPDTDDGEILGGDEDAPAGGDTELEEPSTASVTEPEEAESEIDPEEDDGIIIDDDTADGVDDDRAPGEWPSEPGEDEDDREPDTDASDTAAGDDESPDVEPFGGNGVTVPSGKFRCPECEFTTDVASSSLRAGDFCPECHKGALVNTAE